MLDDEYQLDYFSDNGFTRKKCPRCGKNFWTRDADRSTCGDPPCDPYTFIGSPVFSRPYELAEMREAYLAFFESHDHTRIGRYPVVARWRDDIYLTIASIADFQPFVTKGLVPPPANPLTISQPCIRLDDLDSVGRSGRHLTTFEMMAHHAFNTKDNQVYWKDKTVEYCDSLLKSLGLDLNMVTYKENPWAGGGNAGPCVEVMVAGLELATLVFMDLEQKPDGTIMIKDEPYVKMDNYIVDTGYGLERFVWASRGSPTIYDAVFPAVVNEIMGLAGIDHAVEDAEYARILSQNARLAGLMDISGQANLMALRKKVAESIGIPAEKLAKIMEPVETVYAITDHTRCLAFMLGDGIIPSNVKAGYLARLVIRRTMRMLGDLHIRPKLSDLVSLHIDNMPEYPEFRERMDTITEILALEEERFADTLDRGRRLVQKTAAHFRERNEAIPEVELIQLYDTHGIPPEIAKEAAALAGVRVELSDTFYSLVAKKHNRAEVSEQEETKYRLPGIKPTLRMYYDAPAQVEFRAKVVAVVNGGVVLDRTLFYPEGGGQPADHGTLYAGNESAKVLDVQIPDGVIVHEVDSDIFREGDEVTGKIDWERRSAHMRHHTATHIINDSAKKVLGKHIWQTGAQKSVDRARLDITHFKRITGEELNRIEMLANREVMADIPVEITWKERVEAEKQYGFVLYQGGVPPGREIRILKVGDDVEACGGTHVPSTGRIGAIKVLKTERIQDGVERIEFAAGDAAVKWMQERDRLLDSSADVLRVSSEHLPETVERFFNEWKDLKKENERLKEELAGMRVKVMLGDAEEIGDIRVIKRLVPDADMEELLKIASEFSKNDEVVALLASADGAGGARLVVSAGAKATLRGINAGAIAKAMSGTVGGGGGGKLSIAQGGGPRGDRIDKALIRGIELIREKLG